MMTVASQHNINISQYQELSYPGEIQELCGRMQQGYAILSHRTLLIIQRDFMRKSGPASRSVGVTGGIGRR